MYTKNTEKFWVIVGITSLPIEQSWAQDNFFCLVLSCPVLPSCYYLSLRAAEQDKNFTFVLSCRTGHQDDRTVLSCAQLCYIPKDTPSIAEQNELFEIFYIICLLNFHSPTKTNRMIFWQSIFIVCLLTFFVA
jgi:hypothetical protein